MDSDISLKAIHFLVQSLHFAYFSFALYTAAEISQNAFILIAILISLKNFLLGFRSFASCWWEIYNIIESIAMLLAINHIRSINLDVFFKLSKGYFIFRSVWCSIFLFGKIFLLGDTLFVTDVGNAEEQRLLPKASCLDKTLGVVFDLLLLIPAGLLLFEAAIRKCFNISYDPTNVKMDRIPILLIHGKGYNQIQWKIGRRFLDQYGSVFSLDYDGLVTNGGKKSIEDYAIVLQGKITEIALKTKMNQIILIGHSLGGLIASSYAENRANEHGIIINHIITIATPWHEPAIMHCLENKSTLFKQMTEPNLINMRAAAIRSIENKTRSYYAIESLADAIVTSPRGIIDKKIQKSATFKKLGHYGIIIHPDTWNYVCSLLD
ncbi:MAG: hypothetical protein Harvfovirus52_5 [Harvfovirus sp.]|uniref:GPI inositol-deacylase PGAP1-like alpha/beta domain-containing protein n=1 Tax=Harvfovirus sp. TaxID=2487768 RepID=A0A3G5A3A4_9VIRU|nr:MAG: hypothetical protein Harvfovirus52_5 [Harvfovirus sp.]